MTTGSMRPRGASSLSWAARAGRCPPARHLAAALGRPTPALPAEPVIAEADRAAVSAAARAWLAWYSTHASEPEGVAPAWQPERMEYTFALAAPAASGETVLIAPEYSEGRPRAGVLLPGGASLRASADGSRLRTVTRTLIPTPVSYRGMPAARWWEFEEAEVNFGQIDAGPTDLLRLLLLGFALDFGNDWFVAPVELDVGSINRVRSLVGTDPRRAHADPVRRAGRYAAARLAALLSRAGCGTAERGRRRGGDAAPRPDPCEHAERRSDRGGALPARRACQPRLGGRARGGKRHRGQARPPRSLSNDATRASARSERGWQRHAALSAATTVPDYWLPLVPVRIVSRAPRHPAAARARAARPRWSADHARRTRARAGAGTPLSLFEEEVPRAGARVTRAWQYARWMDGTTHLWIGRRNGPGRGEGWSGLRFDVVEPL